MRPDRRIQERLDAVRPAARAERIGEFCGHSETRSFGELLIDLEEDKTLKAVI
jgi:hypothetical protein